MKIKDISNDKKSMLEEVRYNKNTKGKPLGFMDGKASNDKKRMGSLSILGIMSVLGYFDEARKDAKDKSFSSIIEKMLENSNNFVNNKGIKL